MKKIDEKYLDLEYGGLHFQVKLDHEGVVLDIFKGEENVATTYKFYEDFGISIKEK